VFDRRHSTRTQDPVLLDVGDTNKSRVVLRPELLRVDASIDTRATSKVQGFFFICILFYFVPTDVYSVGQNDFFLPFPAVGQNAESRRFCYNNQIR